MADGSFFGIPGTDHPAAGLPEQTFQSAPDGERQPTWSGEYVSDGDGRWTLDATAEAVARAQQAVSDAVNRREAKHQERMNDGCYRQVYLEDQEDCLAAEQDNARGWDRC